MAHRPHTAIPHHTVDEIARRYEELGIPGERPAEESRLILGVLRAIAEGEPVTSERLHDIATQAPMGADAAEELLSGITERDQDGDVIGLMGLTQNRGFDIVFTVEGRELRTWCALDSLFLPLLLDREATVAAGSALHGEPVHLTAGPDGVRDIHPAGATVSLVIPSVSTRRGIRRVEDMWQAFCHQVRFFASPGEAEEWAQDKQELELAQLSVEETYELASRAWADLRSYARS